MDGGYIALIAATFSILFIFTQRIEEKRRRIVSRLIFFVAIMLWVVRWHLRNEHIIGLLVALLVSYLFWLLIGRYNPVGTSDEIKVYGMDD